MLIAETFNSPEIPWYLHLPLRHFSSFLNAVNLDARTQQATSHSGRADILDSSFPWGLAKTAVTIGRNLPGAGHSLVRSYFSVSHIPKSKRLSIGLSAKLAEMHNPLWLLPQTGTVSLLLVVPSKNLTGQVPFWKTVWTLLLQIKICQQASKK